MVADMTDDEIWALNRGGHDPRKVYAAYAAAVEHTGQPTVILAKTIKGYGMGEAGEGQNITHQQKKMNEDALLAFRDRFEPAAHRRAGRATSRFYKPADDCAGDGATCASAARRSAARCRARRRRAEPLPVPDAVGLRGPARRAPATARSPRRWRSSGSSSTLLRDKQLGRARRADRARRVAHVRHGGHVPPARDLQPGRPALQARGRRAADVLPRGQAGPDPPGGHQRGRARSRRGSPRRRRTPTTACR